MRISWALLGALPLVATQPEFLYSSEDYPDVPEYGPQVREFMSANNHRSCSHSILNNSPTLRTWSITRTTTTKLHLIKVGDLTPL